MNEWANLRTGPEWREFGYAGPVPIFLIEALVVAQSLHNRARLASDQAPVPQITCCGDNSTVVTLEQRLAFKRALKLVADTADSGKFLIDSEELYR